jgi:hypothetical protein
MGKTRRRRQLRSGLYVVCCQRPFELLRRPFYFPIRDLSAFRSSIRKMGARKAVRVRGDAMIHGNRSLGSASLRGFYRHIARRSVRFGVIVAPANVPYFRATGSVPRPTSSYYPLFSCLPVLSSGFRYSPHCESYQVLAGGAMATSPTRRRVISLSYRPACRRR